MLIHENQRMRFNMMKIWGCWMLMQENQRRRKECNRRSRNLKPKKFSMVPKSKETIEREPGLEERVSSINETSQSAPKCSLQHQVSIFTSRSAI